MAGEADGGQPKRTKPRDSILVFVIFLILHIAVILNFIALSVPRWSHRTTTIEVNYSGTGQWSAWNGQLYGPGVFNVTFSEHQGLWEVCYDADCYYIHEFYIRPEWFTWTQCLYVFGSILVFAALVLFYWFYLTPAPWKQAYNMLKGVLILSIFSCIISTGAILIYAVNHIIFEVDHEVQEDLTIMAYHVTQADFSWGFWTVISYLVLILFDAILLSGALNFLGHRKPSYIDIK